MGSESRAGTSLYSPEPSPGGTDGGAPHAGRSTGWRTPPLAPGATPPGAASPAPSWGAAGPGGGGSGVAGSWRSASSSPLPGSSGGRDGEGSAGGPATTRLEALPAVAAAMMAAASAAAGSAGCSTGPSSRSGAGDATLAERRAHGLAAKAQVGGSRGRSYERDCACADTKSARAHA
jgi:hypothetical protein